MPNLGKQLIHSRYYSLLVVVLFSVSAMYYPFVFWGAAVVISLITLVQGPRAGGMLAVWAVLPVIALALVQPSNQSGLLELAAISVNSFMVWLFAMVLRRTRHWGSVFEVAVGTGVVTVFVITQWYPELLNALAIAISTFLKELQQNSAVEISPAWLNALVQMFVGYFVLESVLSNIFSLMIARAWQAKLYNPGGFGQEMHQVKAAKILGLVLVIITIGVYYQLDWAFQLLPIVALPFIFAGVSLVHALAAKTKYKLFILLFFYFNLVFSAYITLPIVILGAFVDSLYDFRKRFVVE